jgi:hypothetical protein
MTPIERLFDHNPIAEAVWSLRRDQCKYPTGDEDSFAFCSDKRAEGSSYCTHHHAISNIAGSHRSIAKAVTRTKTKPVCKKQLLEIPAFEFKPVPRKPRVCREPRQRQVSTPSCKLYMFNGENLSLTEWSLRLGTKRRTLQNRLMRGWTVEQAFSNEAIRGQVVRARVKVEKVEKVEKEPRQRKERSARRYEHNGRSQTLRQWAEETGVNYSTMRNRVSRGWSIEHILMPTIDNHMRPSGRNREREEAPKQMGAGALALEEEMA